MIHAYDKMYLEDVMENLAVMLDFAVNTCGYKIDEFYSWFLISGVSDQIAMGSTRYLAGLSGVELADSIVDRIGEMLPEYEEYYVGAGSVEYWVGWALAYIQWYTGKTFKYLDRHDINASLMIKLYPTLHEADNSKLISVVLGRLERARQSKSSTMTVLRRQSGLTQTQLAELSGVSLRMIRAYEQKTQDLSKAEARTVLNLSKVLHCEISDLLGA